jgi:translation initiation factor 2D
MTPGLANGPPFPEKAKKGSIVAIASTENPSVPLVIGTCEIDIGSLEQVQGAKGQAVRTVTWSGDELWAWSASGKAGGSPPEHIEGWIESDTQVSDHAQQTGNLNISNDKPAIGGGKPGSQKILGNDEEEKFETAEQRQWTTKGVQIYSFTIWFTNTSPKKSMRHSRTHSSMGFMKPKATARHRTMAWHFH